MEAATTIEMPLGEPVLTCVGASSARAEVRAVELAFGGHTILDGVTFDLRPGELALLRGENGSGKTVLLNVLSGHLAPDRGSVRLRLGDAWINAARSSPERLARLGVGRLWQDIRLFPSMTVLDNVLTATPRMLGQTPWLALVARPAVLRQERAARERALQNLAVVGMADRAGSSCDMLSVGQMKRVAVARLLQMEAYLLLLDEPLAGLDAATAEAFANDLGRLRSDHRKTILIVEHRHELISHLADRVWRMHGGHLEEIEANHV